MFEGCPLGALGSWVGSGVSGLTGWFGRGGQLRCQTAAPILQVFKRPTGIQAGASANELRDLLKRGEIKLRRDFVNRAIMEQQHSGNDVFGCALSGSPADLVWLKRETEAIRHPAGI
jgi:hypothetical protein